jgi:hypothetical protein
MTEMSRQPMAYVMELKEVIFWIKRIFVIPSDKYSQAV